MTMMEEDEVMTNPGKDRKAALQSNAKLLHHQLKNQVNISADIQINGLIVKINPADQADAVSNK